ncbi:hypothetical protein EMPS_10692 [Entomortierella parvispora]|uniref:Uncharacterized protein n=1 Tax=Entomortierella parvispora TaxID=205924 RepID=A0A9P3HL28_9FUNG|nr:hypothetical protein EMPS_08387 [Entomortierella parvispora]GJJ78333.1 hypothetical protein EMPS_10692 [Entomortierella parvispora]
MAASWSPSVEMPIVACRLHAGSFNQAVACVITCHLQAALSMRLICPPLKNLSYYLRGLGVQRLNPKARPYGS